MATKKYVSLSKLSTFLDNLKTTFASKEELNTKANASHIHDDRYYTESEIDAKLATKSDTSHTHTVSNISDLTVTATELNYTDGVTSNIQTQLNSKSSTSHNHDSAYDTKGSASEALASAKSYADSVKNDLLNGAGAAYDTLKELGDLIDDNTDAIEALEIVAAGKADASHTHDDRYYTETEIDTKVTELESSISDKADSTHTHATSDITSGRLSMSHGGTGSSQLIDAPANAIIRKVDGDSSDYLWYTPTNNGALYATKENGYPQFGTLPIAQGGTGSTTKAGALSALGAAPSGYGVGAAGKIISNTDLLDVLASNKSGKYRGKNVTNAPEDSTGWWYYDVSCDSTTYSIVNAWNYSGTKFAYGVLSGGTFSGWTVVNGFMGTTDPTGTGSFSLNREADTTVGNYSVAIGYDTEASGNVSYAEGYGSTASGGISHAEGHYTTASENYSHAEGCATTASGAVSHAEGHYTTASGGTSHAEGYQTTASGDYSHAAGFWTTANSYQYVVGRRNRNTTAPTSVTDTTSTAGVFIVGVGTSDSNLLNGFRVNPAGKAYAQSTLTSGSGADYAEYFEWADDNPNDEDRRGRFVALDGEKIRYATAEDDYILGIISANPAVIGDAQMEIWQEKYLNDIYGAKIEEVVEVEETEDEFGNIIPAHTERRWVLNPDYDPEQEYIPRELRSEWDTVGIVGKLVVVDDGTCEVNGYCYPSVDGIATASESKTAYRVMERLDDTHIKVFVK